MYELTYHFESRTKQTVRKAVNGSVNFSSLEEALNVLLGGIMAGASHTASSTL